ncbi:PP2C family protein-serine/threonine phosphatase [Actinoplanes sp. NPDC051859]|uniref:PP2C family protein-serine/threonine phosphatase n=1 Tax=Actinoplanes sp. NPDC051859 TaxID=3363909 RepID=UPI00378C554A
MKGAEARWAGTLHHLWRAVAEIESREDLAALVLPALQALPGVHAAWGIRYAADGSVALHRWAGLPLEGQFRTLAEHLAAPTTEDAVRVVEPTGAGAEQLRAEGVTQVLVARLDAGREPHGIFLVAVDNHADVAFVSTCLVQVIEVTRAAVHRLAATRTAHQQQVRDALLAEASLQMDAVLDTTQTMYRVPRMAVPAIAEGCLVYAYDDGVLRMQSSVHVDMRRLSGLLADQGVVRRLDLLVAQAVSGAPARADDADATVLATRVVTLEVLRARGRVIGVMVLLFDRSDEQIPPATFRRDLAARAALAIDNGTLYEQRRREVVTMQQHLLPSTLPQVDGVSLAASYRVGDRVLEVGGDFYDVVIRPDGSLAALIGDVCGRGVDAAALTGMSRHTLAALLQEGLSPVQALTALNARLRLDGSWRFVTAAIALCRFTAEGLAVEWTSAGHPVPILQSRSAGARPGRGGGVPLGVLAAPKFGRSDLVLTLGDTLLMFTDGLTESRDADGRMFEAEQLGKALEALHEVPVDTLVDELSQASAAHGTGGADDIAVLAIRARE